MRSVLGFGVLMHTARILGLFGAFLGSFEFRGHLVNPRPPTFCGFHPLRLPKRTPRHLYQWSLGAAGGQPGPRTVGANSGSTKVPRAKKSIFFKFFLDHFRCSNKCCEPILGPWWRVLPLQYPKLL